LEKIHKDATKNIVNNIPNNRNLCIITGIIHEISQFLKEAHDRIEAMEKAIPKVKDRDSINSYINRKIRGL